MPSYIQIDSSEEKRWLQKFPDNDDVSMNEENTRAYDTTSVHQAAILGDLISIKQFPMKDLTKADQNGWQPIHEAARAGNVEVLEYLVEEGGADVNVRTHFGRGGSPLYWARVSLDEDHEMIHKLKSYGAVYIEE